MSNHLRAVDDPCDGSDEHYERWSSEYDNRYGKCFECRGDAEYAIWIDYPVEEGGERVLLVTCATDRGLAVWDLCRTHAKSSAARVYQAPVEHAYSIDEFHGWTDELRSYPLFRSVIREIKWSHGPARALT